MPHDASTRRQPLALCRFLAGDNHRSRSVVHAARVAGSDRSAAPDDWLEARECLEIGQSRMFVGIDHDGIAFALRDGDGHNFGGEAAALLGGGGLGLAP